MAAYASIVSLRQLLGEALESDRPADWIDHCDKEQIQSLHHILGSLQAIFDNFEGRTNSLNDEAEMEKLIAQVRDVVMKAKEVIETHMFDWRKAAGKLDARSQKIFYHRLIVMTTAIGSLKEKLKDYTLIADNLKISKLKITDEAPSRRQLSGPHDDIVVGFDKDVEILRCRLCSGSEQVQIIPIEGIGGIGKTTLARQIYNDHAIRQHFDLQAWTTIRQDYNVRDMLLQLLCCLTDERMDSMECSELKVKLQKILKGPRYLIVLDDTWDVDPWEELMTCFPQDFDNGSRILITTRNLGVAKSISGDIQLVHSLSLLNTNESWNLLCEKVFKGEECPPHLQEDGKEIAERCRGLRLVIVVIAGVLSKMCLTKQEWKQVAENLKSIVSEDINDCLDVLALSYKNLPYHLKPCFLSMGLEFLPKDFEISKSKLIMIWVAEGFLRLANDQSPEEAGEHCLDELMDRNLILIEKKNTDDGTVLTYKMHDLLRELALREAKRDKYSRSIRRVGRSYCNSDSNRIVHDFLRSGSTYNHLDLLSRARALEDHKVLSNSLNLRYLHLPFTCEFSAPLTNLLDLQTMVVNYIMNTKNTLGVLHWWKMSRLRHLHCDKAYNSFLLQPPPIRISATGEIKTWVLNNLQTLHGLHPSSCLPQVFRTTPNLKSLIVHRCTCFEKCHHVSRCLQSLHHLSNLIDLKLHLSPWTIPDPHPRLSATSQESSLPQNLKKLTLRGCFLPWEDMEILGMLPNLEILKLETFAFLGDVWELTTGGFCRLKYLSIENVYPWNDWRDSEDPFPRLESLVLKKWYSFKSEIPASIGQIQTLRRIEVHECPKSLGDSALKFQQDWEEYGNNEFQVVVEKELKNTAKDPLPCLLADLVERNEQMAMDFHQIPLSEALAEEMNKRLKIVMNV